MKRTIVRGLVMSAGVCAGLLAVLAGPSARALPPVMDRVPEGAMLVVALPDPNRMQQNIAALANAIEQPLPPMSISDLLGMAGVFEGVDATKSMALVVMPPRAPADKVGAAKKAPAADGDPMGGPEVDDDNEPADPMADAPIYILIPTDDYPKLLGNFAAKPADGKDAVTPITLNDGTDVLAKDLGNGYAVIARQLKDMAAFKPGKPGALKDKAGPVGDRIADSGDLVMLIDMEVAGPILPQLREFAQQRAMEMGGMSGFGMEIDPAAVAEPDPLSQMLERDGRAVVAALKLGALGLGVDGSATFKPGSEGAKLFAPDGAGAAAGNASAVLGKLPTQPFIAAFALDLTNAAMRKIAYGFATEARKAADTEGLPSFFDFLGKSDGVAFSLGSNPALLAGGGLFNNAVAFMKSADPEALATSIKAEVESLNGKTFNGMTMTTAFKPAGAKAGTDAVDDITMKIAADPDNPQSAMTITQIFGPGGGPSGYMYHAKDGLVRTFARNSLLMQAAIKSSNGSGPSLAQDQLLAQVGEQLPKNRMAEAYIGLRPILDIGLPALMMFAGVQIDPADMPKQLPPIGMGLGSSQGAAHFGMFIPAPVIKTGVVIATAFQQAQLEAFDNAEPAPAADDPDEQPRF